jgi:Zn-dependent protease with chaperone function
VFELKFENEEKYGEIDGIPVIIGYEKGKKVYNAFYTPLKRKIFVTKSLKDVLSGEELKAVIYHESGHSKNKWWMITRSTAMMFWVLIAAVVLTTLFLLEMGKFQPNLKVSLFITLGALLIIYATFFMVFSWINEHEADLFAVKKSGYENFSKALFKTYFYNVLGDYAEFVGKIDLKNFNSGDVTPFEILKILLKQSIYYLFPRNILNQPIPQTHPPLRYRILLAHQTLKC